MRRKFRFSGVRRGKMRRGRRSNISPQMIWIVHIMFSTLSASTKIYPRARRMRMFSTFGSSILCTNYDRGDFLSICACRWRKKMNGRAVIYNMNTLSADVLRVLCTRAGIGYIHALRRTSRWFYNILPVDFWIELNDVRVSIMDIPMKINDDHDRLCVRTSTGIYARDFPPRTWCIPKWIYSLGEPVVPMISAYHTIPRCFGCPVHKILRTGDTIVTIASGRSVCGTVTTLTMVRTTVFSFEMVTLQ
jgi:hypothetical protein